MLWRLHEDGCATRLGDLIALVEHVHREAGNALIVDALPAAQLDHLELDADGVAKEDRGTKSLFGQSEKGDGVVGEHPAAEQLNV